MPERRSAAGDAPHRPVNAQCFHVSACALPPVPLLVSHHDSATSRFPPTNLKLGLTPWMMDRHVSTEDFQVRQSLLQFFYSVVGDPSASDVELGEVSQPFEMCEAGVGQPDSIKR